MAGPKVQMISPYLSPSCCPSELIANDNIRKGHNGVSANNLPPWICKNLNVCRSYKRVMDDCLVFAFAHAVKFKKLGRGGKDRVVKGCGGFGFEQFVHKRRL